MAMGATSTFSPHTSCVGADSSPPSCLAPSFLPYALLGNPIPRHYLSSCFHLSCVWDDPLLPLPLLSNFSTRTVSRAGLSPSQTLVTWMEMNKPLTFVLLLLPLLWPLTFMVAFSPVNNVYMNAEDTPASLTACVTVSFKTSKLETINTIFFPFCHGRLSVLILTSFIIPPKTPPQEGFSDEPHSGIDPFLHVS